MEPWCPRHTPPWSSPPLAPPTAACSVAASRDAGPVMSSSCASIPHGNWMFPLDEAAEMVPVPTRALTDLWTRQVTEICCAQVNRAQVAPSSTTRTPSC